MPNFDVTVVSGVSVVPWEEAAAPHRSNVPHLYRRVSLNTATLTNVVLHCTVGGTFFNDAGLAGNLFTAARVAWSGVAPFAIAQTPGTSAEITLSFAPNMIGHQELCIRRPGGGAILLSFETEATTIS